MYFFVLFLCIFCIIFFNLLGNFSWAMALNIFLGFVIVLLPCIIPAFLIRLLPKKWFNPDNKIYSVSKKETQILIKLGIKKWKDKIPELGQLVNFKKNKITETNNTEYIKKFIQETCYAETLHISCIVLSLAFMFLMPNGCFWNIAFPIAVVFSLFNIPSILIQRFNRPRLKVQLKRLTKKNNSDNINAV